MLLEREPNGWQESGGPGSKATTENRVRDSPDRTHCDSPAGRLYRGVGVPCILAGSSHAVRDPDFSRRCRFSQRAAAGSGAQGVTDYARNLLQRVVLVDGERLTALMIEPGVGTRLQTWLDIQRLDDVFFSEE